MSMGNGLKLFVGCSQWWCVVEALNLNWENMIVLIRGTNIHLLHVTGDSRRVLEEVEVCGRV